MEFDIDKLVGNLDFKSNELVKCSNGLMLTNKEIEVLKRYDINYQSCSNLKQILSMIEEVFNDAYDDMDDLDEISLSIAERDYYQNTNK